MSKKFILEDEHHTSSGKGHAYRAIASRNTNTGSMKISSNVCIALACVGAFLACNVGAVVINIDTYATGSSGAGNPGTATLATLELTQDGDDVDFEIVNSVGNLNDLESGWGDVAFITQLYFNYDGTLSATDFTSVAGSQLPSAFPPGIGSPGNNAGYTWYVDFKYPTSNSNQGTKRFKNGENTTWTILNTQVDDFLVYSTSSGKPDGYAMIHIQGVSDNGYSLKYVGDDTPGFEFTDSVPVPAPLALISLGGVLLGWMNRKSRA